MESENFSSEFLTSNLPSVDLKQFPSTRYQGSKRKILPWIYENLKNLEFHTALDVCGGTGVVSYLLKKMNKEVTYNDFLKFNFHIGRAIIENDTETLTNDDLDYLLATPSVNPNFIHPTFKGVYYLDKENQWLDDISYQIRELNDSDYKKNLAYYALFQSCLTKRPFNLFHRKNLHLRTNDVKRNFGNKTTWDKNFKDHFLSFAKEVNNVIFKSEYGCRSMNRDLLEVDPYGYDLVYIDPPYVNIGKNETNNYEKCYHFLEGLANYSEWALNIDSMTKNLRYESGIPNHFTKASVHETFENIFEHYKESKIVLSYKLGGTPSIDDLVKLMKRFKSRVYIESMHYKYALNKQNGNAKKNREVLIIGV